MTSTPVPSCYEGFCDRLESFCSGASHACNVVADLICPCLRRSHRVAPSPVKSPNLDFVEVTPRGYLRVLHVLPFESSRSDQLDGAVTSRSEGSDLPTNDFWFNHWQGPHITAVGPARRKASTNTFGPADEVGRARKTSMTAQVSQAEVTVRQLLDQTIDDAVRRSSTELVTTPGDFRLEERDEGMDGASVVIQSADTPDAAEGVANPAYEPNRDDPGDLTVKLPDATVGETETDDEREPTPPPPSSGTQRRPPPPQQQQQPLPPPPTASETRLPLLFFLHGVGGSAEVWTSQIKHFSQQGYECVAPDLLGHGFSSAPSSPRHYSFHSQLQHVRCVFKKYATSRRRVVVIGHSYGSSFATVLAREYLNVVLLVLVSSGGPTPLAAPSDVFSLPICLLSCLKPLLICGFKTREMFYTPRGKLIEVEKGFDVPSYVLSHTMRGQFWPEGDLSFHKQITLPTLLLHGMKDKFVSLVEMCDMEKAIPRAFLETIPNAGHMVMLEAADETNQLIGQFLDRWLHPAKQRVT